jgi:3-oxoacyl-[acyl-carrier protein] reductase
MEDKKLLEGKTAIITGGTRGIGYAACRAFAREGANILFTYISSDEAAEEALSELISAGARADAMKGDAGDAQFAGAVCERATELFGGIDILINNAGITRDALIMRMKPDDFDEVLRVNLNGAFYMLKAVTPIMMKRRYGRIINITSAAGVYGNAGQANYAASKAGLIGLTKSAAKELGSRGITVNAVAPGLIETDMAAALTDEQVSRIKSAVSLGRLGRADEVAELLLFLVSEKASYITSQIIGIDGGIAM